MAQSQRLFVIVGNLGFVRYSFYHILIARLPLHNIMMYDIRTECFMLLNDISVEMERQKNSEILD